MRRVNGGIESRNALEMRPKSSPSQDYQQFLHADLAVVVKVESMERCLELLVGVVDVLKTCIEHNIGLQAPISI